MSAVVYGDPASTSPTQERVEPLWNVSGAAVTAGTALARKTSGNTFGAGNEVTTVALATTADTLAGWATDDAEDQELVRVKRYGKIEGVPMSALLNVGDRFIVDGSGEAVAKVAATDRDHGFVMTAAVAGVGTIWAELP